MTQLKGKRVLLVADAYKRSGSPALVTRHLVDLLQGAGAFVGVYSEDIETSKASNPNAAAEFPRPANRLKWFSQLLRMEDAKAFASAVSYFCPDIVHFVPISYRQPYFLFDIAKSYGAYVVGQLWGPCFYCSRHYAFLYDHVCGKCANGDFYHAILHRCYSIKQILIKVLSMYIFRSSFKSVDVFLSTSKEMDARLAEYGIKPNKIVRFPLPFSRKRCEGIKSAESDHIIYYGQAIREKGVHFLAEIVGQLPNQKFEFYFSGSSSSGRDNLGIEELKKFPNVTIRNDMSWETGVAERLSSSLAVLIPSIWPTTTETVLMESLGLGKPIVAFNVGVHSDLLRDHENTLVYSPGDINGFIEGIKELTKHPELRKKLSEGAHILFKSLTDTNNLIQVLGRAYTRP